MGEPKEVTARVTQILRALDPPAELVERIAAAISRAHPKATHEIHVPTVRALLASPNDPPD